MAQSFDAFLKKKYTQKDESTSTSKEKATTTTTERSTSKPKSFDEFLKEKHRGLKTNTGATSSASEWADTSSSVLSSIQKYYSEYHKDDDEWYESYNQALDTLLSAAS